MMREYTPITMSELIDEEFGEYDVQAYRIPTNIEYAAGYRKPMGEMQPDGERLSIHQALLTASWTGVPFSTDEPND